jgi:SAM-dependent methyltransferase
MSDVRFWNAIARKYAARPIDDPASYEDKLARLRSLLGPEDHVLEVGCGSGNTARALAPHVGRMVAADLSPEMIAIARERSTAAGEAMVDFHVAAADDPPRGEAPYDAVLAFSLLHLVDDLPGTLAALHDRLRPGGLFISKTACLGDGLGWLRPVIAAMRLFGKAPPVAFLRREALARTIAEAGFEIIEVSHFGKQRRFPFIVARRS